MYSSRNIRPSIFVIGLSLLCWTMHSAASSDSAYGFSDSSSQFEAIDKRAIEAPKSLTLDINALTRYLTSTAKNDTEKARALFTWLAHNIEYDAEKYFAGTFTSDEKASDTLTSRKALCTGYSGLFHQMASLAGMEVVSITGRVKGFSFSTHGRSRSIEHRWNAVKIDGKWQLLDPTWGAGYLDGKTRQYVQDFENHYFLTPPEQFIIDHLPDDPQWQLLEPPVATEEFYEYVQIRPAFYKADLTLDSHRHTKINTDSDQINISLVVPEDTWLSPYVIQNKQRLPDDFITITREGGRITTGARFPEPGDYKVRFFVKKGVAARKFDWALDYAVNYQP